MSIPVVADADTLFAAATRGLLIYLDYQGVIKLHWSPLILDEVNRALVDTGRKRSEVFRIRSGRSAAVRCLCSATIITSKDIDIFVADPQYLGY
ncbi:hypothetical protein SAMN04488135_1122 [Pollutimonas bauzanensis]|uniref:PIN domain-containing protein n=1 Tax=Pollutimonas bauzanensis TaxID=658167 RepID=A0A1M5Z2S1_9BURK|nr:hypothetical protein [Pollutimonas bauzanensis]SHI18535.1 hypothetical protein SAMN04488135_1122 [Pollutimonas bauzanensis]